jgi:hypothetical protein
MKKLLKLIEENSFPIVATVEKAQDIAKSVAEKIGMDSSIVTLGDGTFSVVPTACLEETTVQSTQTYKASGDSNYLTEIIRKLTEVYEPSQEDPTELTLLRLLVGCLLSRSSAGEVAASIEDLTNMDDDNCSFMLESSKFGIRAFYKPSDRSMH